MGKTTTAPLICEICKKPKSPHGGMVAELIRRRFSNSSGRNFPTWTTKRSSASMTWANSARTTSKSLQDEIGELSALDHEVIESLQHHEILSSDISKQFERKLTFGDRLSDRIAELGGSWKFIITFMAVLIGWILVNVVFLLNRGFDPYPFILLNLVLSCLAAIQAPVVMMSQNPAGARDRPRGLVALLVVRASD